MSIKAAKANHWMKEDRKVGFPGPRRKRRGWARERAFWLGFGKRRAFVISGGN